MALVAGFIALLVYIIIHALGRPGRMERDCNRLEASNEQLRRMVVTRDVELSEVKLKYLRVLRDYRFSQKANTRHKRHIRRLRETLDMPEVKDLLARNADPAAHNDDVFNRTYPVVKVNTDKLAVSDPATTDTAPTFKNDPLEAAGQVARTKLPKVAVAL